MPYRGVRMAVTAGPVCDGLFDLISGFVLGTGIDVEVPRPLSAGFFLFATAVSSRLRCFPAGG